MDSQNKLKKSRVKDDKTNSVSKLKLLKNWLTNHKKTTMIVAAVITIIAAALTVFIIFYQKPTNEADVSLTNPTKPAKPKQKFYSPLTGVELSSKADTEKPVTAIIIENSPDARPQSGMQQAEVTYEAIAEAGITRFLNLYQQNKPGLVGPVRSLRPYFVEWIAPWQASVAHVGGSKRSLDEVRNGNYRDIDQFFNAGSYWRSSDRYAPHNVYTNFEKLDALNASKNYVKSEPKPLKHTTTKKTKKDKISLINVTMSSAAYNSNWTYHEPSNTYHRQQGGAPHMDREEGQISSRTVIILKVHMDLIMEDGWRESYHTSGTGEGVVFQDGQAIEVIWHKPSPSDQIFFTSKSSGKELPLARGKIWISAVPANKGGNVTWQ
ncbi:DUF3048 domain-containing protein [Candidatus Saccharibacteria bacterium]|jgi:hypothetical protein|nr:DUF3048 domain-containing protein [Candidatus Saccharibacteria bacterium]